jgi:hypothetical protein
MREASGFGMKIAIVHGGFDGVRRQMSVWRLEREVVKAQEAIVRQQGYLRRAERELVNRQAELDQARKALT